MAPSPSPVLPRTETAPDGGRVSRSRLASALGALAATATLVWLGLGVDPWWPLAWFAPLPVLLLALRCSRTGVAGVAAAAWLIGSLELLPYLQRLHSPLPTEMGYLVAPAIAFAASILLFQTLVRRGAWWRALGSVPACGVTFEFLRSLAWPHGTAGSLAYTQLDFLPVLQLASVAGPWGIVFVVLLFPTAIALGLHLRRSGPHASRRVAGAGLGIVATVLAFGAVRLAQPPDGSPVSVGLVAADHSGEDAVASAGAPTMQRLRAYAREAGALAGQGAAVIVLPEKLGLVTPATVGATDALFQDVSDRTGTTIVVGVVEVVAGRRFNRARFYAPHSPVVTYDKQHLLPQFESGLEPGRSTTLLPHGATSWGVEICKDLDFVQPARTYGAAGVGLLLVPAWDFQLDRRWHGHIARMRGVENGFAVARSSREGNLTVSDRHGRIVAEARSDHSTFTTLLATVPTAHERTVYCRLGDTFAWLMLGALVWVVYPLIRR